MSGHNDDEEEKAVLHEKIEATVERELAKALDLMVITLQEAIKVVAERSWDKWI